MVRSVAFLLPAAAVAQFGGQGGDYTPPAPICPAFSCGKGEVAVGKTKTKIVSYGCKDSGMNVFNMASLDPSNPMAGMNKGGKNLNKCCVERDICKQTCGMTSKDCFDGFQKCQKKICNGDQNCNLQAMISDLSNDPFDKDAYGSTDPEDKDKKYDPEASKCRGYNAAQANVCQCVLKDVAEDVHTSKLTTFYSKYNPEKLDENGEIKDVEEVWKKWKGKEKDMFVALATKYKEKVVEIQEKPKYTPPKNDGKAAEDVRTAPSPPPQKEKVDADAAAFDAKLKKLTAKKDKAKKEEDYDAAIAAKEEIQSAKEAEAAKLKAEKEAAIEVEDYARAKKLKARIAKLEL